VRPNSISQNHTKSIFSAVVKSWRSFTDTQRSNWNTFAINFPQYTKNDDTVELTGFNAFVKWQSALWLGTGVIGAADGTPVTSLATVDTASPAVTLSGGILSIVPNWNLANTTWDVNWFISSPKLPSQLFFGSNRRFIVFGSNGPSSENITVAYVNQFGVLPAIGDEVNLSSVLFTQGGGVVLAPINYRIVVS
jgi:hypothetical protein